jgi:hypothetical protein
MCSVIKQLNDENFFLDNWEKHFPSMLPIPVPNDCSGEQVPLEKADHSLTNVMNRGVLRVGVHKQLSGYPALYSLIKPEENDILTETRSSNGTTTKNGNNKNYTLDIRVDSLEGYETDAARAATERLGVLYIKDIAIVRGYRRYNILSRFT